MEVDYSSLSLLLKASSKSQVKTLFRLAHKTPPVPLILKNIQEEMELSDQELDKVLKAIVEISMVYLRNWPLEFPTQFHGKLKELVVSLLEELAVELKRESQQPGLSKLTSFDWRLDTRNAVSKVEKSPVFPRVALELNLEGSREVVELTKNGVVTFAESLDKIKEQLDSLAEG